LDKLKSADDVKIVFCGLILSYVSRLTILPLPIIDGLRRCLDIAN